jgi:2,4-dienoyl-CoA reductase-like NADH-dependent reductase (Old Yellow Enzyme family)
VLEAVRSAMGSSFPIVVRINAADYVEGGLTIDDALAVSQALAGLGANALSVSSGTMCESVPLCQYPAGTPKAHWSNPCLSRAEGTPRPGQTTSVSATGV